MRLDGRKGMWLSLWLMGWVGAGGCSPEAQPAIPPDTVPSYESLPPPVTGEPGPPVAAPPSAQDECSRAPAVEGWVIEQSPSIRCPMYAVLVMSPTDVWLAGDKGQLYRWDGTRATPQAVGMDVSIRHLWASAPDDVWAGGLSGALLRFNGTQWRQLPLPTRGDILTMAGSGPDDVWVLASGGRASRDQGYSIVSFDDHEVWRWDGATWSQQSGPAFASSLAIAGASDVWVGATSPDYQGRVYHWDGASWTAHTLPERGYVSSLAAVSPTEVWALVTDSTNAPNAMVDTTYFRLYRFDGTAWTWEPFPELGTHGTRIQGVYDAHGGHPGLVSLKAVRGAVWIKAGYEKQGMYWDGGKAALLRREGTGWRRIVSLQGDNRESSTADLPTDRPWTELPLDGAGRDDVWIIGFHGQLLHWDGSQVTSHQVWEPKALTAMWGSPSGDIWAVGNQGVVLRRTSAGWRQSQAGLEAVRETFTWISGRDDTDIWAGGPNAPTIHWDGQAWTRLPFQASAGQALGADDVLLGSSEKGLWRLTRGQWTRELPSESVILSISGRPGSAVWVSCLSDEGIHLYVLDGEWHAVRGPDRHPWAVSLSQAGDVLVRGGSTKLYRFFWRGWRQVTTVPSGSGSSLSASSLGDVWLMGEPGEPLAHYDGSAWTKEGPAVDRGVFTFSGAVWAFDRSGVIYRRQP